MNSKSHNHYLSNEERSYIFSLHKQGFSYQSIKTEFKKQFHKTIYNSTINGIIEKVEATGSVETLPKSGRPKIYNERESRTIIRASLAKPLDSLNSLVKDEEINPKGASEGTFRNILSSHKVVSRVLPKRMADLTKDHVKDRLFFANEHLHWDVDDWQLVIFSDEADLFPKKTGKQYVRFKEGQKLVDIIPLREGTKKFITIKVWGAISSLGPGPLVRYEETMKGIKYRGILIRHLFQNYPMLESSRMEEEDQEDQVPAWAFVQDNASSHTAKIVQDWINENEVNSVVWPANSPDLNIIENVWAYVQDKLYEVQEEIASPDETWQRTQEIWNNIPLTYIENLYLDLPIRIRELKKNKGGPLDS